MEKLLSIEEVAEILGLEYKTVYRLVKSGDIPSARIGRVFRVSMADLYSYLERQKEAVRNDVKGEKHFSKREIRCGCCEARIVSELGISGRCRVCDAALCAECFGIKKVKLCKAHESEPPES